MTIEAVDSLAIQGLDSQPILAPTAGEGAAGELKSVQDTVTPTAAGMATIGSIYRLCRFPTYANIMSLVIDFGILDTGAATATFDINVAFSDSNYDGTNASFTQAGGATAFTALCIPQTTSSGLCTSATAYTTPNKLFGSVTVANNAVKLNQQVLFNGAYAAGTVNGPKVAWFGKGPLYPLWDFFGFVNSQGYPADPGGMFDILLYLSTAANTGASADIHAKLDYIV